MNVARRVILLFTRAPEAEAREKRLPLTAGAQLFSGFLAGWRHAAASAGAQLLVLTPESSRARLGSLLPGVQIAAQEGPSFAERLENAFAAAFAADAEAVLMVGGDCPAMAVEDLHDAFNHLQSHEKAFVLAPANDGGVNAIGFSADAPRALAGIHWLSRNVCLELETVGAHLGLSLLLTTPGWDLDSARGIRALYRISVTDPLWREFRWLLSALYKTAVEDTAIVSSFHECRRNASGIRGPPAFL